MKRTHVRRRLLLLLLPIVVFCKPAVKEHGWTLSQQCHMDSPGYIVETEVRPWIIQTLDELSEMTNRLLSKMSEGLEHLEPHIDRSPMFHLDRVEYFNNITANIQSYFKEVYNDVLEAWWSLQVLNEGFEGHLAVFESKHACVFAYDPASEHQEIERVFNELLPVAKNIEGSHRKAADILNGVLRELSVAIRAITLNSLTIIMDTLQLTDEDDEDRDRLLESNLYQVAPNFFGLVLRKLVKRGTDSKNYKMINKNVLGEIEEAPVQLQRQLQELSSQCFSCAITPTLFRNFWRSQAHACKFRVRTRPPLEPDTTTPYRNDEFLSEVTLALMASYQ